MSAFGGKADIGHIDTRDNNAAGPLPKRCKLPSQYPLFAQSGHSRVTDQRPLLGVKRTSRSLAVMSAFDPKRTSAPKWPLQSIFFFALRNCSISHDASFLPCASHSAFARSSSDVSFAQIWLALAVQLRCRKIFLLCPSIAILRRTDLLYLPKIRIDAYSLHRPHPDRRTLRKKRRILRRSCR